MTDTAGSTNWYQRSVEEAVQQLHSSVMGLDEVEAAGRLERYGPNRIAEDKGVSRLKILLNQFTNPLVYLILVAAVVTAVLRDYVDAAVILAVVLLNATIGFAQEYKAEESVQALKKLVVAKARVLRNGQDTEVNTDELVPGDVVLLSSGAKVPADLRLFEATELYTEEAMLTGESLPAQKTAQALPESGLTLGDQRNVAFAGTIVVRGRGKGLVVATGRQTVLGQIAREVQEAEVIVSPLQEKMIKFARLVGTLSLVGTALIAVVGLAIRTPVAELLKTAVATMVAAVPEGLPIVVTITMAVGISKMARRNAVIRKLPAVETLGSTTVICSDKTGTLTKNEMTVRVLYDGQRTYEVTGSGYEPEGEILPQEAWLDAQVAEALHQLLRVGLLCNESSLSVEDGKRRVNGDPTEGALITAALKGGLEAEAEKATYRQLALVPFESERGYMATLHQAGQRKWIFVKGGPERVVELCSSCGDGQEMRASRILDTAQRFATEGMRVLACAYREAPADLLELTPDDVGGRFVLAGLQGMIDPPRPGVMDAVRNCKRAGVRVVMITGDHATTALAIARKIGIVAPDEDASSGEGRPLTGKELEVMSDDELFAQVQKVSVFARVSPQHKLRIVQQLRRHGEVVAVTGDGVNDAPALKAAHIGVAMGITGTDVAKETADMVVADDNFASIFSAVEEGRVVFDNIRKVILFLIPSGLASILSILLSKLLRLPLPYVAVQMLWVNLVTGGLQDISLALEPAEKGVVDRPPRKPQEGVMSRLMVERTLLVGVFMALGDIWNLVTALGAGYSLGNARSLVMTTRVFSQLFQVWNCRSERESVFRVGLLSNPYVFFAGLAAVMAQLAVLYIPLMQSVFETVPLAGSEWLRVIAIAASVLAVVEIDKLVRRRQLQRA